MATIVTRAGKGSPLTSSELDQNQINLNTDKAELSGAVFTGAISGTSSTLTGEARSGSVRVTGVQNYVVPSVGVYSSGLWLNTPVSTSGILGVAGTGVASWDSTGIDVTGTITASGEITANGGIALGDSDVATFGASDDLKIHHNGSNSYIQDSGTGDLIIAGTNLSLRNYATDEIFLDGTSNAAVRVFYNGAAKLATTATGIDVTGTVVADGLTVGASAPPTWGTYQAVATVGDSTIVNYQTSNRQDLELVSNAYYNAGWKLIKAWDASRYTQIDGAHSLQIAASGVADSAITWKDALNIDNNGDISFYEDTGTTAKFFWDASLERLGLGTASPQTDLHVKGGSDMGIRIESANDGYASLQFGDADDTVRGAITYNNADDTLQLRGYNNTTRMTIDSSGNVGIGGTPYTKVDIRGTSATSSATLQIVGTGVSGLLLGQDADGGVIRGQGGNNALKFYTGGVGDNAASASGTERMRINSAGAVSIGTTATNGKVSIQGSGSYNSSNWGIPSDLTIRSSEMSDTAYHSILQLVSIRQSLGTGNTANGFLGFSTIDDSNGQGINDACRIAVVNEVGSSRNSATALSFWTNAGGTATTAPTEKMRLDSSGNVLVGKTAANSGVAGLELSADGSMNATVGGDTVSRLNRLTSDGEILRFQKDTATVGSIGTYEGTTVIAGKYTGLKFNYANATNSFIHTVSPSGAVRDAVDDLGYAGSRFKDLYLSGGVYLGGTGAANKLDDYEEGTWTPAWFPTGGSWAGTGTGRYTKVGRLVTVTMLWAASGTATGTKLNGVSGLPFTSANDTAEFAVSYAMNGAGASGKTLAAYIAPNVTSIYCQMQPDSNAAWGEFTPAQTSSSSVIRFTATYFTA